MTPTSTHAADFARLKVHAGFALAAVGDFASAAEEWIGAYERFRKVGDLTAAQGPLVCLVGFARVGVLNSRPDLVVMIRGLPGGGWDGEESV